MRRASNTPQLDSPANLPKGRHDHRPAATATNPVQDQADVPHEPPRSRPALHNPRGSSELRLRLTRTSPGGQLPNDAEWSYAVTPGAEIPTADRTPIAGMAIAAIGKLFRRTALKPKSDALATARHAYAGAQASRVRPDQYPAAGRCREISTASTLEAGPLAS